MTVYTVGYTVHHVDYYFYKGCFVKTCLSSGKENTDFFHTTHQLRLPTTQSDNQCGLHTAYGLQAPDRLLRQGLPGFLQGRPLSDYRKYCA